MKTGRAGAAVSAYARMSEPVVLPAFLRIGQHLVGLGYFLELLFGLGIVGIPVGMVLERLGPKGALQHIRIGVALDAEYFVVIGHGKGTGSDASGIYRETGRRRVKNGQDVIMDSLINPVFGVQIEGIEDLDA